MEGLVCMKASTHMFSSSLKININELRLFLLLFNRKCREVKYPEQKLEKSDFGSVAVRVNLMGTHLNTTLVCL